MGRGGGKCFNGTNKRKRRYEVTLTKSDISHVHVRSRRFIKMRHSRQVAISTAEAYFSEEEDGEEGRTSKLMSPAFFSLKCRRRGHFATLSSFFN